MLTQGCSDDAVFLVFLSVPDNWPTQEQRESAYLQRKVGVFKEVFLCSSLFFENSPDEPSTSHLPRSPYEVGGDS